MPRTKKEEALIAEVEKLKAERNLTSKEIGLLAKKGVDTEPIKERVREIGEKIKSDDDKIAEIDLYIKEALLNTPNVPSLETPVGFDDKDNVEVYQWGKPKQFDFEIKDHAELGEKLGILDFPKSC